ncbi:hypothetical protein AB6D11_02675 [Vibrio splendidus]
MNTLSQQIKLLDTLRSDLVKAKRVQNHIQIITHNAQVFRTEAACILSRLGKDSNATVLKLIELSKEGVEYTGSDRPSSDINGHDTYTLNWYIGNYTIELKAIVSYSDGMHHSSEGITITTNNGESLQENEMEDLETFLEDFGERNHSHAGVDTSYHYRESSITNPNDGTLISNYIRNTDAINNLLNGDSSVENETLSNDVLRWASIARPESAIQTEVVIYRRQHAIIETTSRHIVPSALWSELSKMDDHDRHTLITNSNEAVCTHRDVEVNEVIQTHELQVDGYK